MTNAKILILGLGGMVGHKLFDELSKHPGLDVWATTREIGRLNTVFGPERMKKVSVGVDATKFETIVEQLEKIKPDVVINCIGITKQLVDDAKPIPAISINSLLPHWLAEATQKTGRRLIQMATDCVFNGSKGNYLESDPSNATDLYGRSKFLGEVYYPHCLTVRTSFIGHELGSSHGLVAWFLAQDGQTKGFTQAIYSGLPTVEIARVMAELIIPNNKLSGLYQVSSEPISKFDLLTLVAKRYGKKIEIIPDASTRIDRSLNSDRFRAATGFQPEPWENLIDQMYTDYNAASYYPKRT